MLWNKPERGDHHVEVNPLASCGCIVLMLAGSCAAAWGIVRLLRLVLS